MYRLDTVQNRLGAVGGMKLPLRASEYIKRQVYATFISDPVLDSLQRYGADNIMWSSDYPHTAATFPRSGKSWRSGWDNCRKTSSRKSSTIRRRKYMD